MRQLGIHQERVLWRAARILCCATLLVATWPASAHGPMPKQDIEVVPGRILIKAREGVALVGGFGTLLPHSPQMATLNSEAKAFEARPLFPHYGREAMLVLEDRALRGLAAPSVELRTKMADLGRWLEVSVDPNLDPVELAERYAALEEIEQAEPDYLMRLVEGDAAAVDTESGSTLGPEPRAPQWVPNDPDLGLQWGLDYIDAPEAWFLETGSPAQVIAIIDTGVDLDHPDLASKIWVNADELPGDGNGDGCPGVCAGDDDGDGLIDEDGEGRQPGDPGYDPTFAADDDENGYIDDFNGWDWISFGEGFEDNEPQDDNGHGTHCAGIAAAATDNGVGGAGACPDCTVMPLKAFQSSGTGAFSDIAKAVEYAWRNGASVISMSFSSSADSSLVRDALSLAFSGASLVAAAGNDGLSRYTPGACSVVVQPYYPAHYSFVLGIEAGTPSGALAGFSNCQYELRNPGTGIHSTVLDDAYASWSGTSMAAPLVAGTAGLLRSLHAGNPAWTPDLVFGQLQRAGANAFDALSLVPEPDLLYISYEIVDDACGICDGDGVADSGEIVGIVVTVRNLWGNATGVTGTLATADPLATVVDGAADWGAIGPAAFDDNADNAFAVAISPATGNNRDIVFDLMVAAANGGSSITDQFVVTVQRGVEKGGLLTVSETWTKDNLYLVTSNLLVMPGATLTIEPGTDVQVNASTSITVRGELIARGTAAERINFAGNPYGWGSIYFDNPVPATFDGSDNYLSGSILEYAVLQGSYGISNPQRVSSLQVTGSPYVHRNIFFDNHPQRTVVSFSGSAARVERNLIYANRPTEIAQVVRLAVDAPGRFHLNTVVGNLALSPQNIGGGILYYDDASTFGNNFFSNIPYDFVNARDVDFNVPNNYWGTSDPSKIGDAVFDFFDNPALGVVFWDPLLAAPHPDAPPVVADITLSPPSPVGVERVIFTVVFSKPMATSLPEVFFGPGEPFTSHPVDLNPTWLDPETFQVEADISVFTGDGLQTITVWSAKDLEGFPIPTGDHRFGFEIVTSGTSAAQLSATGDVGHIDLSWFSSALPDAAGYNLYRSETSGGPYAKLNSAVIVDTAYADHTALPGVTYFYIYRVVTTDLLEGPDSDEASGTALDTVPSEIVHSAVSQAPAGQSLTLLASITDNIAVIDASAYHRPLGGGGIYAELPMINAVGDQYTVNIPAVDMTAPGVEYYLEATDGVSITRHGTPATPHQVTVQDVPVILSVDPTSGTFAGGDLVTITGSNFVDPPLVRFGGTASPSVTFVSSSELTAETPAHYPALVDIEVENPSTAVGRLTNAFTFTGNTATLTLPAAATGDRLTNVQLAVNTASAEGMLSALLTVQFDATVLTATGATAGNLTTGFSVSANTTTPGEIVVSLANATPVTGAGDVALLSFDVVGAPDAVTALTFDAVELNDGAIPATPVDGQLTVNNSFDLSGAVSYYQGAVPVPGTQLDVTGSGSFTTATDGGGIYGFTGLPSGDYALTPSKNDAHSMAIVGPLDASMVLQHSSGLIALSGHQATAADVNKAGGISPFDASLILQYSVGLIGLPFPGNPGVWEFSPSLYSYTGLDEHQANQDFTAILTGDVTGNWTAPAAPLRARTPLGPAAELRFDEQWGTPGATVLIPVAIDNADGVLAALATIRWQQDVLAIQTITTTAYTAAFSLAANLSIPGEATVGLASATSLAGGGNLLLLTFQVIGDPGETSPLDLVSVNLNEGAIGAALIDNQLDVVFPNEVSVAADSVSGTQLYEACVTIFVGPDLTIAAGADVTFRAGEAVVFLNDVAVEPSAEVTVETMPLAFCH